jgi:hypothetical protein
MLIFAIKHFFVPSSNEPFKYLFHLSIFTFIAQSPFAVDLAKM